jgi:hypothetical protein
LDGSSGFSFVESVDEDSFFSLDSDSGLDTDEDSGKSIVSHFFEGTEETGFEEDFGVSKSEFVGIKWKGTEKFLSGLFTVQKLSVWDGIWVQDSVSLFKVSVLKPVWKTFSANSDSFEDTVTSELMDGQMWIHDTWVFVLVWNDAPDEMWGGGPQVGHQSTQRFSVKGRDSLHRTTLLLLLFTTSGLDSFVFFGLFFWRHPVGPDFVHEHETGLFKELDNGVVQWILVLFQPVGNVVTNATGVMVEFEIDVSLTLGFSGGFTEVLVFTHMGQVQFILVGFVGGFWEHTFFFKSGQDTHWLFDQFDASSEIHTEIDSLPENTFLFVFFLFKDEHMVVEKLLKFLVGEVDAQLFEGVETENFETGDIEATDVESFWQGGGKSAVTLDSDKVEQSLEDTLGEGSSTVVTLFWGLTFGNVFGSDLNPWVTHVFTHVGGVDSEQVGGFVGLFSTVKFTLFFSLLLLESHLLEVKNGASDLVDTVDDFWREFEDFKGFLSGFEFFTIVETLDGNFTHTDVWVLVWILDDQTFFDQFWEFSGKALVKDMVVPLTFELVGDSRFFQKVGLDIS